MTTDISSRPARPPRITYVITSSGIGGAERQVRDLALTFAARGWSVAVISMLPLEEGLYGLDAHHVSLDHLGMSRGIPDPRGLAKLIRILRATRPDIVHSHMVHANLLARVAKPFAPVSVLVSTMHNQDEGHQWRYLAYRLTDSSDLTTTVSQGAVAAAVARHAVAKGGIMLVPNGVATATYEHDPGARLRTRATLGAGDGFIWLAVGRLTEAKDYPMMLNAFASLLPTHQGARLWIAGQGEAADAIAGRISAAGLNDRVTLLGPRSDVPALMQAADAYVLSSAWEGLPMVLLEAGASGLPIVATDVGGTREAVLDGETGLVCPPGDSDALSAAMTRLMDLEPSERTAMGEAGRAHIRRTFDLDAVADRWAHIYRSLITASKPAT